MFPSPKVSLDFAARPTHGMGYINKDTVDVKQEYVAYGKVELRKFESASYLVASGDHLKNWIYSTDYGN